MKTFIAFAKKEFLGQLRTYRVLILSLLFIAFGIMNPAVAKMTPWLLDLLSESLAESNMTITATTVSALDSWVQFFKNMPMALIAFVVLEGNIFTREYQKGTLILSLTKGLERYKVVLSKAAVLTLFWTVGYWLCYTITYACNSFFWDNGIAQNLLFAATAWWLFGLWVTGLLVFFSALFRSFTAVLGASSGIAIASYLFAMLPRVGKYSPAFLTSGASVIFGNADKNLFTTALIIALVSTVAFFAVSIPLFNKKDL